MHLQQFSILKKLHAPKVVEYRLDGLSYLESVIYADLPFKPGVYLMYGVVSGIEKELLYIGKAGHTGNNLNAHPLPVRLLASEPVPEWHMDFDSTRKKFIRRTKLIPDKVKHYRFDGLNIYCYETSYTLNSNKIEKALIHAYKKDHDFKLPNWMHK